LDASIKNSEYSFLILFLAPLFRFLKKNTRRQNKLSSASTDDVNSKKLRTRERGGRVFRPSHFRWIDSLGTAPTVVVVRTPGGRVVLFVCFTPGPHVPITWCSAAAEGVESAPHQNQRERRRSRAGQGQEARSSSTRRWRRGGGRRGSSNLILPVFSSGMIGD